ncbi:hypothetical protein DdX_21001 [Ditylenchus destructor]|uniref:Uncharacterized protein n=1 Tax=Ditylenchus destructor TaxID=166010 RepID=A0AAD4QVX0_9BILA|nr:hypothetical protein DdX_21001 [Ditylenchus destructor]
MQELNLFAIVEFAKLAKDLSNWLLTQDNTLTEDKIWLTLNHTTKPKKLNQEIKSITDFLHNKLFSLQLIGKRQVRYVVYLANEDRKVFHQKPSPMIFPPMSINKYELVQDDGLSVMDNNMYGSKNLVASLLSKRSLEFIDLEIDYYLDPDSKI